MYAILSDFINTEYNLYIKVFPINLQLNSRKEKGKDQESIQSNRFNRFEIKS